jgi:O-antigen ligase
MMGTILNPKEDYNYTEAGGRKQIWQRGIVYMLEHPIAGVGLNNFGSAEGGSELNRQRASEGKGWVWAAPHNSFVQVGAESGVTGLALFIAILLVTFNYTMRRSSRGPPADPDWEALKGALAGALIGYCFAGFFLSQAYAAYLYSLLGIVAGMMKIQAQPLREPRAPVPPAAALRSRRATVRRA